MRFLSQHSNKLRVVAVMAALGLVATGCGGSDSAPADGKQVTDLVIGAAPSLSGAGTFAAIADGTFKNAGLNVSAVPNKSANESIPQLLNGANQFVMVDTITVMQAIRQGIPVKIVAPAGVQSTNGEDRELSAASVLVKADSSIARPSDLEGKTVGVPGLKNQTWMNIRASIDADGGDSSKVEFIEAPPAQAVDLIMQGRVSAATPNEPLASMAIAGGDVKLLMNTDAPGNKGVPSSVYVATNEFIAKNPDTVKAFVGAVQSTAAKINADRSFAIKTAIEELNFKPEQLENAFVQTLGDDPITPEELERLSKLAVKYGVLEEVPKASDLLADLG